MVFSTVQNNNHLIQLYRIIKKTTRMHNNANRCVRDNRAQYSKFRLNSNTRKLNAKTCGAKLRQAKYRVLFNMHIDRHNGREGTEVQSKMHGNATAADTCPLQ